MYIESGRVFFSLGVGSVALGMLNKDIETIFGGFAFTYAGYLGSLLDYKTRVVEKNQIIRDDKLSTQLNGISGHLDEILSKLEDIAGKK